MSFGDSPLVRGDSETAARLVVVDQAADLLEGADGLRLSRLPSCQAMVVTKARPGVTEADARSLTTLVQAIGSGQLGRPMYLVLDFAQFGQAEPAQGGGFEGLATELTSLVLKAPVVPVAFVRTEVGGGDLELALACSLLVADEDARFDFNADPLEALGLYALLAQKIGFVRAERLMEQGRQVSADEMKELLLVKEVVRAGQGLDGLEAFLARHMRRHNSFYSIYRAQRLLSASRELLRSA
jgi:hypothetical protein